MKGCVKIVILACAAMTWSGLAFAQDSPAAKGTRKKLQQKISVEWKEVGIKAITEDIRREMDPPVSIKIDNASGVSNNSKLSYKAANKTVEQILNDLSDKAEFGWFIKADPKDRNDGFVIIRRFKEKERGYETGKGPKGMSFEQPRHEGLTAAIIDAVPGEPGASATGATRRFLYALHLLGRR